MFVTNINVWSVIKLAIEVRIIEHVLNNYIWIPEPDVVVFKLPSTSANSGPSTGICYTLQQCYIDTVVTHSTHSSHSNVYLLYNTSIVL